MAKDLPWVVANWKMNGLADDCIDFLDACAFYPNLIFCPSAIYINLAKCSAVRIHVGAQDCGVALNGAYTGDISALALKDIEADFTIVGHSERRKHHMETNTTINQKAKAAIAADLMPIICVGESLEEYQQGITNQVLGLQLEECLAGLEDKSYWIAYEPLWAIGTGLIPSMQEIEAAITFIQSSTKAACILYGGSVNADNIDEITALPCVSGVLVGGASLKIEAFSKMLIQCMHNSAKE